MKRFSFKKMVGLACVLVMTLGIAGCKSQEQNIADLTAKAEKGDVNAMVELGEIYFGAKNTDWNDVAGAKWMKMAAEKGNAKAQYVIGVAYANGYGVPIDMVEAHKWEYLADCNGFRDAKESLQKIEKQMSQKELKKAQEIEQQQTCGKR